MQARGLDATEAGDAVIELRWAVPPNTTTEQPRLQMRVLIGYMDASGALNVMGAEWSEWKDVPRVVLPVSAK